jgi:hypothetical protein
MRFIPIVAGEQAVESRRRTAEPANRRAGEPAKWVNRIGIATA